MVRKTKEDLNTGEVVEERRYYISSIYDIDLFSRTTRNEWAIENKLHWYLDYTLKEDYSTIIDVGKKYSLKNKIHYINDNFESFFQNIIEQLSSQASTQ